MKYPQEMDQEHEAAERERLRLLRKEEEERFTQVRLFTRTKYCEIKPKWGICTILLTETRKQ